MAVTDIARVYATSLVELAQKKNILDQVEAEMQCVSELIIEETDFASFLNTPGISKDEKAQFISKIFEGRFSQDVVSLLCILIENDRQSHIKDVCEAVVEKLDEAYNRLRVQIITSGPLDNNTKDKIVNELKNKFKKEIILKHKIKEDILGGIIIKIGDIVIDGSLEKDLKNIRKKLINSKIRSEVAYED